jgi:hypothetical protein
LQNTRKGVSPTEIEFIGLVGLNGQDYYIDSPSDIARVFAFIKREDIKLQVDE